MFTRPPPNDAAAKHPPTAGFFEIPAPDPPEEGLEGAGEAAVLLNGAEEVVPGEGGDVVGRLAPFSPGTVDDPEPRPVSEQDVVGMKIPVHLAKPVGPPLDSPAPGHAASLDSFQQFGGDEPVPRRIAVQKPHDALAVSHELTDPADVKAGVGTFLSMDVREVVAKGVGPRQVEIGELSSRLETGKVPDVAMSLHMLDEEEELLHVPERKEAAIPGEPAHVQGMRVKGKVVICLVIPEKHLGPVRHVFVPEGSRTRRLEDGLSALSGDLVLHHDLNSVA